jgi:glycosyltransferase involved in cell wall biosynthesis
VVVPCYNHARYLPEAVASVLAQTEPRWELIVVDDGSPDDTAAVAAALIRAHPGRAIRLLRQPNRGLAASRNAGIAAATAPYVLPLDADDALEPEFLAATAAALDDRPALGFVYTQARRFGAEATLLRPEPYDLGRLRNHCTLLPASLVRRAAWAAGGGFCEHPALRQGYEDWDFWLALGAAGWGGALLGRPLLRYRRAGGSMVTGAQRRDLELRAAIIARHAGLYERGFVAWAAQVLAEAAPGGWAIRSPARWLAAFAAFNLLIARYAPGLLPVTLLRPIFWRLPIGWQGRLRPLLARVKGQGPAVL